jgi:drug/metabolite transporter (DMT)-like permease
LDRQRKAYTAGLAAVLAWSTVATAFKISLRHLTPAQLLLVSSIVSLAVLLIILAVQGRIAALGASCAAHWRRSLLFGAINPFVYYLVLFQAYALLPAQEAQAINYTWALTLTLMSVPVLGHALRPQDAVAALICYLGVLVIATHGDVFGLHFASMTGVGLALLSTLLWAGYWLLNTRDKRDPIIGLTLNFAFSLPLTLLWCLWRGELASIDGAGLAGAAWVGVFEMGLTFVLWLTALKLTARTASIANLIFLSPLVSLLLIHFIVGEPILPSTGGGLLLILLGLAIQKLHFRRPPDGITASSQSS